MHFLTAWSKNMMKRTCLMMVTGLHWETGVLATVVACLTESTQWSLKVVVEALTPIALGGMATNRARRSFGGAAARASSFMVHVRGETPSSWSSARVSSRRYGLRDQ